MNTHAPSPGPVLYREEQRFTQPLLWILVLGLSALFTAMFVAQVVFGIPVGSKPAPDWAVWLLLLGVGVGLPAFFRTLRLTVQVHEHGLDVRYFPLAHRWIEWRELRLAWARNYRPIFEYGGWGIRWGGSGNWAYNVRGDRGVQLVFQDGSRLLIGSQQADELAGAIRAAAGLPEQQG